MTRIQDVAHLAQVSTATASRALSRPQQVAAETRERVLEAARQLGYQPNVLARSLRQGETRTLGLIVADILNPFHALLAKGVQDTAERHGYSAFLFNSDEDPQKERRALETLRGQQPQGVLIVPTGGAERSLQALPGLPVVELDRVSGQPNPTVTVDNLDGAMAATRHLTGLGHTRIGMVVGQQDISTATERHTGFRQALRAAGVSYDPALVRPGHHREDDGYRAALELLSLPEAERPTALFVGNNEMTVGAVLAARELGLRIPEDLSMVGFDDSRWAQTMWPPLTVVSQPAYELGVLACDHLVGLLTRRGGVPSASLPLPATGPPAPAPARLQLPTQLIVRRSTAPPATTLPAPAPPAADPA